MEDLTKTKNLGIGSLSLLISIFAIMFSFTFLNENYIGVSILRALGVSVPTSIISLILFGIAIFIGSKYKDNYFAKAGKFLSIIFIAIIIFLSIVSLIV